MKLSYRDKVIFICAIVMLILVAGFFLFIKPKYTEMTRAKSILADKETEKAGIEERINTLPVLVEQVKEVAKGVEEPQKRFIVYQDPYLNEQLIYDMLEENNVEVTAMSTRYITPSTFYTYTVVDNKNVSGYPFLAQGDLYDEIPEYIRNKLNGTGISPSESFEIGLTSVDISYNDDLDLSNILNFYDQIAEDERTIRATNYRQNFDTENITEDEASGTVTLQILHLFPLNIEKVLEESDQVEIVPVAEEAAAQ